MLCDSPMAQEQGCAADVSIVRQKSTSAAPAWVHASSTSMRLVQTGRAPAGTSHTGSTTGAHSPRASSQAGSHAFQQAPWMGHGGVRNLELGHTGQPLLPATVYSMSHSPCTDLKRILQALCHPLLAFSMSFTMLSAVELCQRNVFTDYADCCSQWFSHP